MTYSDKRVYEGEFKNNMLHGKGKFFFAAEGHCYEGEYVEDTKEGQGIFKWADGREYRGGWRKGKMHGEALFKSSAEAEYRKGIWEDGRRIKWIKIFKELIRKIIRST